MYLDRLFKMMADTQASDVFISSDAPINMKVNGVVAPVSTLPMDAETVRRVAYEMMSELQAKGSVGVGTAQDAVSGEAVALQQLARKGLHADQGIYNEKFQGVAHVHIGRRSGGGAG